VADGRGVYVDVGGITAVRDGAVAWRRSSLAPVEELRTFDGGLLVRTDEALVALDGDGERRWRRGLDPSAPMAVAADHAVVPGDGVLGIGPDGTVEWLLDSGASVRSMVETDGRVAVVGEGRTRAVDAADGTRLWSPAATERPPATVVGTEALYGIYGGWFAVAVDGTGRRWSRRLESDRAGCGAVAGGLDGETVAFLLESGELVWLQRTEQARGLLQVGARREGRPDGDQHGAGGQPLGRPSGDGQGAEGGESGAEAGDERDRPGPPVEAVLALAVVVDRPQADEGGRQRPEQEALGRAVRQETAGRKQADQEGGVGRQRVDRRAEPGVVEGGRDGDDGGDERAEERPAGRDSVEQKRRAAEEADGEDGVREEHVGG
jgi:hypothetical protein